MIIILFKFIGLLYCLKNSNFMFGIFINLKKNLKFIISKNRHI